MAVTLVAFDTPVATPEPKSYSARACGRERTDHLWEGWIEFESTDGEVLASGRETTQPNLTDLEYWAQGLTPVYLEGALKRTLEARPTVIRETPAPAYSGPAPTRTPPPAGEVQEAVLDPYTVYQQGGLELLQGELSALSGKHLRQIIRAYGLASDRGLESIDKPELIALIAGRVQMSRSSTIIR